MTCTIRIVWPIRAKFLRPIMPAATATAVACTPTLASRITPSPVVDGTQFKPAVPEIGQAAGTYNGQTMTGIGLTKASAIYYRAESVYQTPTTHFAAHDMAVQTSCSDLIGMPLNNLSTTSATGTPSAEVIARPIASRSRRPCSRSK